MGCEEREDFQGVFAWNHLPHNLLVPGSNPGTPIRIFRGKSRKPSAFAGLFQSLKIRQKTPVAITLGCGRLWDRGCVMTRPRLLSLFSGIGAMDYGLERAGMECVAQCEADPFCRAVLRKHWPHVPCLSDVRSLARADIPGSIDVVAGGPPCQPHSVAGKRLGQADARHLWPEMARIIGEFRPAFVLVENVPGIRTTATDEILADMESQGYACGAFVVGAEHVGAPHRRHRVWIVGQLAHAELGGAGAELADSNGAALRVESGRGTGACGVDSSFAGAAGAGNRVGHAIGQGLAQRVGERGDDGSQLPPAERTGMQWPSRPCERQYEWEAPRLTQFGVGRAAHGPAERLVRFANRSSLRALGNAVIWHPPYVIGCYMVEQLVQARKAVP